MRYIETERLILRTLKLSDSERVEELASNYEVAKTTLNIPHPYPEGSAQAFIERVLDTELTGKLVSFAIIDKKTESLIGIINVGINNEYQRGELAYWIGREFWGKGFGTEAARTVLAFGFEEMKLNKIFAQSFTTNPGSWRVMEKIGLKYEGTLKQHVFRFGEFYDLAMYGLLREEYSKG